jgi:uncharacterized Zn finger protein
MGDVPTLRSCCLLKRPLDYEGLWTCPECGTTEREVSPEEMRASWSWLRRLNEPSEEEVAAFQAEVYAPVIAKLEAVIDTTELGLTDLQVAARRARNGLARELVLWLKENA